MFVYEEKEVGCPVKGNSPLLFYLFVNDLFTLYPLSCTYGLQSHILCPFAGYELDTSV